MNDKINALMNALWKEVEAIDRPPADGSLVLTPAERNSLEAQLGAISSGADLVRKVKNMGTITIQGKPFTLNSGQLARLKSHAFAHARPGEPRSEAEATKDQAEAIIQRYVDDKVVYWVNSMIGEI